MRRYTLKRETVNRVVEPDDQITVEFTGEALASLLGTTWTKPDGSVVTFDSIQLWYDKGWKALPLLTLSWP